VQGLALHLYAAAAYGVAVPDERRGEAHVRPVDGMLDHLLARDGRPLAEARPPKARLVGVCRHFAVLLVAALRAKGVPARARCGFADYLGPGSLVDHWVCERWDAAGERWVVADAQLDDVQRARAGIDFDPLDVPRDRFLTAGEAWARCRAGTDDPSRFGIFDKRGLWFIAGSLVRDLAALNRTEMLAWDMWGAMPRLEAPLTGGDLTLFDRLAALTRSPDASFEDLRDLYEADDRLRVPATVLNAVLGHQESIGTDTTQAEPAPTVPT
jgi:hypothetical protein